MSSYLGYFRSYTKHKVFILSDNYHLLLWAFSLPLVWATGWVDYIIKISKSTEVVTGNCQIK
jgi:hypothetical protein